ncbi:DUF1345 domain-containing protein [Hymenobacter volaticus]|uniref:DUF1345 domain-containing protein n=1 Tax=Hymenobacter volaticus TaxID=2932254 RepID=A0ABY4G4V6_9BACT|nr:DUF1345 domain-containing protein [Hymenobacter volaticus]UOQ65924.1 DUF1345 domain-containing protein [Hymenobacter volaticus]
MPHSTPSSSLTLLHRLGLLPTWLRFSLGLVPAAAAFLLTPASWHSMTRLITAWDAFSLTNLVLAWGIIASAEVKHIRRIVAREDPGRHLVFALVLVAASSSLLAVIYLLSSVHATSRSYTQFVHMGLASLGVMLSWLLVHTMFTLRYAHIFYGDGTSQKEGGLQFPGEGKEPDYFDFAYFSFVVGMTAQTADISILSQKLRRLALLHGLLSFGFNTVVVALSISSLAVLL